MSFSGYARLIDLFVRFEDLLRTGLTMKAATAALKLHTWNGKPYKSAPNKRFRISPSRFRALYLAFCKEGAPALQLHYRQDGTSRKITKALRDEFYRRLADLDSPDTVQAVYGQIEAEGRRDLPSLSTLQRNLDGDLIARLREWKRQGRALRDAINTAKAKPLSHILRGPVPNREQQRAAAFN